MLAQAVSYLASYRTVAANSNYRNHRKVEMDQSPQITPEPTKEKRAAPAFVPLILAGVFMVTGICVLLFIGREKARIIGQTITELDIQPLLNADKAITQEAMKGKVVVLHFWGYWNRPSATEYPDFFQLQTKYNADSDVLFASIACSDRTNDTKDSLAFYSKKFLGSLSDPNALNLPVYYDPAEFTRTQISQLLTAGGFTYPTTIVVDGAGRVVDVWRSAVPPATLERTIEKAKKQTRS